MADEKKLDKELTDDEANEAAGGVFQATLGGMARINKTQLAKAAAEAAAAGQMAGGWERRVCACGNGFTVKKTSREQKCPDCRKLSGGKGGMF